MATKQERQRLQAYRAKLRRRIATTLGEVIITASKHIDQLDERAVLRETAAALRERPDATGTLQTLAAECEDLADAPDRPRQERK